MIHGSRSNQFVLNENRRRDRPLIQDVETDANQILPITFGKVCDRADESTLVLTQFSASFGRRVLPHDGTVLCPACFLKST